MKYKVLLIDSDQIICQYLACLLSDYGYDCWCVYSGLEAIQCLEKQAFSLIVMDHQLPDIGGFHLLRQILILQQAQVIILSTDDSEYNRIRALNEGATDFVCKPLIYPAEFLWRIRAILKRCLQHRIVLSRIQINLADKTVQCDGTPVDLAAQLFKFLVVLASKPEQVVEHDQLLYALEDEYCSVSNNILYVLAHRLRCSLESKPNNPQLICTVRGIGYLLNDS